VSRSIWTIGLDFHMLDARKACVPGYEDSTGGHVAFNSGKCKLRVRGPGSWALDDMYGAQPFDKEQWVEAISAEILRELSRDDNTVLKSLIRRTLDQARAHCDENHADIREQFSSTTTREQSK
jgi:hypothetical protein